MLVKFLPGQLFNLLALHLISFLADFLVGLGDHGSHLLFLPSLGGRFTRHRQIKGIYVPSIVVHVLNHLHNLVNLGFTEAFLASLERI